MEKMCGSMNAVEKSILADGMWQNYLKSGKEIDHERFVNVCRELFG